jgi:hypothetical protein
MKQIILHLFFSLFLLAGAFTSTIAESVSVKRPDLSHVIPISLEITILLLVLVLVLQGDL